MASDKELGAAGMALIPAVGVVLVCGGLGEWSAMAWGVGLLSFAVAWPLLAGILLRVAELSPNVGEDDQPPDEDDDGPPDLHLVE